MPDSHRFRYQRSKCLFWEIWKRYIFLSLSDGVGDMEGAAHLHLIPKPTEPWSCPGISIPGSVPAASDCTLINPNVLNSVLSSVFFSDLFPRNIEFHGIDSWSLDGFFIPSQVCLQRLVPQGFIVKSLALLFSFVYFYFISGFMGNRKKLKIHSEKSEFVKVCSALHIDSEQGWMQGGVAWRIAVLLTV